MRDALASMTEEQKNDALVLMECNTKELAGLLVGQGVQAIANIRTLLDYFPTIERIAGSNPVKVTQKSVDRVASSLLTIFKFLGLVKDGF